MLDAGCGTGRVAIRLAELGFDVVGTDVDESMLAVARDHAPHLWWFRADLAHLEADHLAGAGDFDLVVMAGNVVPLIGEGALSSALEAAASLLQPGGQLVTGFGLDHAHLPPGCPVTPLAEYDAAAAAAGVDLVDRFSSWDAHPFDEAEGYVVSVHRRG